MKASKFTEAQSAFVLKQADEGTAIAEICRKAGISLRGPSVLKPLFCLAEEVWQFASNLDEAASATGRREREVEAHCGRTVFGQSDAAGFSQKKL